MTTTIDTATTTIKNKYTTTTTINNYDYYHGRKIPGKSSLAAAQKIVLMKAALI